MTIKISYMKISDGKLIFPDEFLRFFPQNIDLYAALDEEKQRVTIYANDPSKPKIDEFLDALAELSEGLSSDEYAAPVPDHLLARKKDQGEYE